MDSEHTDEDVTEFLLTEVISGDVTAATSDEIHQEVFPHF